jgi:hypothetical protein
MNCSRRARNEKSSAYTTNTKSYPPRIMCLIVRKISFPIRRSRFLRTAVPALRGDTTSTLLHVSPFCLHLIARPRQRYELPVRKARSISSFRRSLSSLVRLFLIGNRELGAAFGAAAFENQTSTDGLHARPESEFSVSFASTGLIGTFHLSISLPPLKQREKRQLVC